MINSSILSPFGMMMPNRSFSGGDYDYGFNGMRKDDEIKNQTGSSYDFGARMYDPRVGRFLSIDAFSDKFAHQSPYVFAGNSPVFAGDKNGDSIIVLIWATNFSQNSYGHTAIAVQNYKNVVIYSYELAGRMIDVKVRVPDGTYTYYDLWPSEAIDASKESTSKAVPADYHIYKKMGNGKIITEHELLNGDPSRLEGRPADGIVKLNTTREMDGTVKVILENQRKNNPNYIGASNNCSDYCSPSIERALNIKSSSFGNETFKIWTFTTPNEIMKDLLNYAQTEKSKVVVLKNTGDFSQPFITDQQSGGNGTSAPTKETQNSTQPGKN